MCVYSYAEISKIEDDFNTYNDCSEKVDIDNINEIKGVLRGMPVDNMEYDTAKYSMLKEDELATLLQRMAGKEKGHSESRIKYISEKKPMSKRGDAILRNFKDEMMEEKRKLDEEYLKEIENLR